MKHNRKRESSKGALIITIFFVLCAGACFIGVATSRNTVDAYFCIFFGAMFSLMTGLGVHRLGVIQGHNESITG